MVFVSSEDQSQEVEIRPSVFMPSVNKLKEKIAKREIVFPGALEKTMRTVLLHPEIVAFGSAKSVAALCSVSSSTVFRLVRQCGYSSFRGMRSAFRSHLVQLSRARTREICCSASNCG